MRKITETDKAYFAGFFDGEGCVLIQRSKGVYGNYQYSLGVSFRHTYLPVVKNMQVFFGGGVHKVNMSNKVVGNKQQYDYHLNGKKAWYFLKSVEPYSKEKLEQVKIGIEFFQGQKGSGRSHSGKRSAYESERDEHYYKLLQSLKKCEESEVNEHCVFDKNQKDISFFAEE